MITLNNEESKTFEGGAKITFGIIATGIISLLLGIFDGLTNPKACTLKK